MDYDDLFSLDENVLMENINDEFNQNDDDYFNTKKQKPKKIEYNNKIGWLLRKPNNKFEKNENKLDNNKKNNLEYIEFYRTSYIPGSNIKNAITGNYYPYLVGSNNEKLLFKVAICTGEKGTLNYVNNQWIAETNLLFYDSPEQYERHLYGEISLNIKRLWLENKTKYKFNLINKY